MSNLYKQCEERVNRTYKGGLMIDRFLGKSDPHDTNQPEDWISSFTEAKNKTYIENEGLTELYTKEGRRLITQVIGKDDFGDGRSSADVLIKLLDSAERLGIQVHPTPEFSQENFGTPHGKTECWHILGVRDGYDAAIYIGFKEGITKEKWESLFLAQDIGGMLECMHRFPVKEGDTVLVRAGTPHAIGAGCFLLEIQEPCDYTMRVEKVTVAGEALTPHQIHYGVGEEKLLDCFIYDGLSEAEARKRYFLEEKVTKSEKSTHTSLVSYDDTPHFRLCKASGVYKFTPDSFVTLVITEAGYVESGSERIESVRGDKIFIPYRGNEITICGEAIICYPPKL